MNYKVNGITLFGVNYRESDKILTLFTLEKGKIGAAARGVRKANAKMKQIAEPFCFSEAVISEKSGRRTITEINSFDSFYPVRTDINKYYAGNCALEFTNAFLPEGLVSEGHFVILAEFLKALAYGAQNPADLLVKFFFDAVNENGFALNLSYCGRCGEPIKNKVFLSSREGICVCENCRKEGDGGFSVDTYKYVKNISESVFKNVEPKTRRNGLKLFGYYIEKVSGVALKSLPEFIEIMKNGQ